MNLGHAALITGGLAGCAVAGGFLARCGVDRLFGSFEAGYQSALAQGVEDKKDFKLDTIAFHRAAHPPLAALKGNLTLLRVAVNMDPADPKREWRLGKRLHELDVVTARLGELVEACGA